MMSIKMQYDKNDVYILNPDYSMLNDLYRAVIFSKNTSNNLSAANWKSFLHPVHAKIFSFFTFDRPFSATISLLCAYFKRDESAVLKIVSPFIENPLSVYTRYRDDMVRIPKNVIVNRNKVTGKVNFLNLEPDVFNCRHIDLSGKHTCTSPQIITFMLNNTCISNCIYCYADTKTKVKNKIPAARILELIEEAETLPVYLINLMGGEIFLHPDWFSILKNLVDCNLSPEYISTKYPITDEIIRSIQKTGFLNPVQISLDACSSGLLQSTLLVQSDYLPKVLQGIKRMDNSGLKYRINSVLTTGNATGEAMAELFLFIRKLKNIIDWRITPAVDSNWIENKKFSKIKPGRAKIENLYTFIENEIVPYSNIPVILNRGAINKEFYYCTTGSRDFKGAECPALNSHLFILPDGKATICEQLYWSPQFIVGDVSVNSISEVWNSPASKRLLNLERIDIQDSSPCKTCQLFESCFSTGNRCWADIVKAYGKENWDYPDPRCSKAPKMTCNLAF